MNSGKLIELFKAKKGAMRFSAVIKAGFHPDTLIKLVKNGDVEKIGRGLYRLAGFMDDTNPDIVNALLQSGKGVICLISALSFHEATDEIPRQVDIAIKQGMRANKIEYPPVKFYRFAPEPWLAGIEEYEIDGCKVKIYSLAKTIADCFKFRNRIGADVARAALKTAVQEKKVNPLEIFKYAKICRVSEIVKPILEAII